MNDWQTLFKGEIPHLFIYIEMLLQNGGNKHFRLYSRTIPFKNINSLSGYYYQVNDHEAMIGLGFSQENQSYVLYRKYNEDGEWHQRWDYFNSQGIYNYFAETLVNPLLQFELLDMDPSCPLLNVLYNYLAYEYGEAEKGTSKTDRVFAIEKFLQKIYYSDKVKLSIKDKTSDLAITQVFFKINENELNPVLDWEERYLAFQYEYERLEIILKTKARVHKLYRFLFTPSLVLRKFFSSIQRFFMRPIDNLKGVAFYWTIRQIFNTFRFVKTNPVLAFALLSYVGFAYYYFTTPQNPYTAHIKTQLTPMLQDPQGMIEDHISFKSAAPQVQEKIFMHKDSLKYDFSVFDARSQAFKKLGEEFEANLEATAKQGRMVEFKNKLEFPLMVEAAWIEILTYQNKIQALKAKTFSHNRKNYLSNEMSRSVYLEAFLWEKLGHYISDRPEVLLDKNNEQLNSDPYFGRSLTLFSEMTQALQKKMAHLPVMPDKERIDNLSKVFEGTHLETGSLLRNLKANSDLFKQKDLKDSNEYRLTSKRQWEILSTQQSRVDENAQKGLEIIAQSQKNTIWFIERFYAIKGKELNSTDSEKPLLRRSLEGLLHFYQVNLLSYNKEVSVLINMNIEEAIKKSIIESEKISNTQIPDPGTRESISVSRH